MYVDGFLLAAPKKNLKAYRSLARRFGTMMQGRKTPFDAKRMIFGGFKAIVQA